MNTREIATGYRLAQWAQIMRERTERGESIKTFCESKDISRNTYFYWQRKLRAEASCEWQPESEEAIAPSGWAVCKETKADSAKSAVSIEIGSWRIITDGQVGAEHLEKICRVLMRLC
jgi:hypothetical protein